MSASAEAIAYAHLVDEYERMRTAALRTIEAQVRLLDLAHHAIQNGRYEVGEEFVERASGELVGAAVRLRAGR